MSGRELLYFVNEYLPHISQTVLTLVKRGREGVGGGGFKVGTSSLYIKAVVYTSSVIMDSRR